LIGIIQGKVFARFFSCGSCKFSGRAGKAEEVRENGLNMPDAMNVALAVFILPDVVYNNV
jgi:hypothetical protein